MPELLLDSHIDQKNEISQQKWPENGQIKHRRENQEVADDQAQRNPLPINNSNLMLNRPDNASTIN